MFTVIYAMFNTKRLCGILYRKSLANKKLVNKKGHLELVVWIENQNVWNISIR